MELQFLATILTVAATIFYTIESRKSRLISKDSIDFSKAKIKNKEYIDCINAISKKLNELEDLAKTDLLNQHDDSFNKINPLVLSIKNDLTFLSKHKYFNNFKGNLYKLSNEKDNIDFYLTFANNKSYLEDEIKQLEKFKDEQLLK